MTRHRPASSEYADYYAAYVAQVPDGDIIEILRTQNAQSIEFLEAIDETQANFRYAEGKWSIKEVVGHILDVEWIFTNRALRFARGDATPLPSMDQDDYVAGARFDDRTLDSLAHEFHHLRAASATLFDSFSDDVLDRTGIASDVSFSVRSIAYILAGHERHHVNVIRERYLA